MHSSFVPRLVPALALALFTAAWPSDGRAHSPEAERLVRAMQLDQTILGMFRWPFEQPASAAGQASAVEERMKACVMAVNSAIFIPPLSDYVATRIEPGEMDDAIAFFESSGWQKVSEHARETATRTMHNLEPPPDPELSAAEQETVTRFMDTELSRKLLNEEVMMGTGINDKLEDLWEAKLADCEEEARRTGL